MASSTLIIEATPPVIEQALELLDQLDKPLDQVVMECKFIRATPAAMSNLAIEWQEGSLQARPESAKLRLGRLKRDRLAMNKSQLHSVDATVLSSPRVALSNEKSSSIHVGDKFPLVSYDWDRGNFQSSFQEVGLKLTTTPEVRNGGKEVRLKLNGEFTYIRELLANQYPLTHSVTFDGQLDIADGQTAILDGLLSASRALEAVSAIPLLADLPVLGHLFRQVEAEGEIYLMLTPNIMK